MIMMLAASGRLLERRPRSGLELGHATTDVGHGMGCVGWEVPTSGLED